MGSPRSAIEYRGVPAHRPGNHCGHYRRPGSASPRIQCAVESLEHAVQREIFEEAGIRVIDPVYLGSQPWPFPASLMLGFTARVDPDSVGDATPDGTEILDLRWFTRTELAASLGDIRLPGRTSIARAIIEEWYGEAIVD